jgi:hypothetical protein
MRGWKVSVKYLLAAALILGLCGSAMASGAKAMDPAPMLEIFKQWEQSKHISTRLVNDGNIKLPDDAMCLICHDGAGYLQWAKAGFDPGWGDDAKLAELGPAPTATCLVCHDQEAKDPAMIRISGTTPMLRGGFKVEGAGSAVACIICHNSRRGLRNDKSKPVADKRAPHEASSADVVYGQNFYFVPNGEVKPHADVDDSCVSCHVSAEYKGGGHTFKASWDSCKDCHEEIDGQAEKKASMAAREALKAAIEAAVTKAAQAASDSSGFAFKHVAEDETEDKEYTEVKKGKITGVNARYFHGQQSYDLMVNGKKYLTIIDLMKCQGLDLLKTEQGQTITKAGWNLYMIDHDRSHGAHNSRYVQAAVKASVAALEKLDFRTMKPLKK